MSPGLIKKGNVFNCGPGMSGPVVLGKTVNIKKGLPTFTS